MKNEKMIDGRDMWPAIIDDKDISLKQDIYFVSEIPNYGEFHTTVFNENWKLVQSISSSLLEINVQNKLFDIANDPYEYENLADNNPDLVREMAEKIRRWRALHPIAGTRTLLVPPPGWRAPHDWSTYTIPKDELQNDASLGFGAHVHQILDFYLKDQGRIIYDCDPQDWETGNCSPPKSKNQ
tara:strand:- start:114 stop:662 length:549 start_codon:yes stop_codon:yes gene_type:complete